MGVPSILLQFQNRFHEIFFKQNRFLTPKTLDKSLTPNRYAEYFLYYFDTRTVNCIDLLLAIPNGGSLVIPFCPSTRLNGQVLVTQVGLNPDLVCAPPSGDIFVERFLSPRVSIKT